MIKAAEKKYFYVIMPIGADKSASIKQDAIRSAAELSGIAAHFPGYDITAPMNDLQQVIHELRGAQFVVADLSFERPSCYYELGIAETLGKAVFLIAVTGTEIHQTSARKSVRYYASSDDLRAVLSDVVRLGIDIGL